MSPKILARVLFSLLLPLAGSAAVGQTCPVPGAFPSAPAAFTHTAVADGAWHALATWGGAPPGNGAVVCIPASRKVTVKQQESSRLRFVQVHGELRMSVSDTTRLYVDTLSVANGGLFRIGFPGTPMEAGQLAEIVFISWNGSAIDLDWDPREESRGLIAEGSIQVFGEPKSHMVPLTANVFKNSTQLAVDSAPSNWKVGDKLVLTGSYFQRVDCTEPCTSSEDEQVEITAISGASIDFTPALSHAHLRPTNDLRLHVANLTRNVVFRSESPSTPMRGHVMLMNPGVDIRHAAFVDLGRTNKAVPLDDFVVTVGALDYSIVPNTGTIGNRRGRYALHFHMIGTSPGSEPPSRVYSSVVNGTTGWGFVNHSSHVDFQSNVAYNFTGAGFVAEMGDELGNFDDNIAIRGTGNHQYRPNQVVFGNGERPQPLADFAFSGDGFWFQGPAVRARNNVASGCDGVGMIWFTTGAPDVNDRFQENGQWHDRYSSFPRSAVSTVYAGHPGLASFLPRYWDHSATDEKLVISDLPILECDGLESYGNLQGFRLRFNNFNNVAWYNEEPFNFGEHIEPVIGVSKSKANRLRQEVKNLKLWNNEIGTLPNYASLTDWSDVSIVNRLSYDDANPYFGAQIFRQIEDTTFTDLAIDGYEVAGWIENGTTHIRYEITFLNPPTYLNYVSFDTWNVGTQCAKPGNVTVTTVSASSRTISWDSDPAHKRYMVRYRGNGNQSWKLVDTTATSVTLTGLTTGRTYTYQVIAGCKDTATGEETAPSDYTAAAAFNT
ncbi:MAG TPA: fibronectin type III domain-containing protein [Thermoanaerobaculia bacterium]|nr:fibronectin type III domain-containing protein [Thermoanaerobaculia bacterium]